MKQKALYIFICFMTIVIAAVSVYILNGIKAGNTPVFAVSSPQYPVLEEKSYLLDGASVTERTITFEGGSVFSVLRFEFTEETSFFSYEVPVMGDGLSIKWQNYDVSPYVWETVEENIPKATLFAETSGESVVFGIPALYYKNFNHNTIENIPASERPAIISKTDGGYIFRAEFEPLSDTVGELWYYKGEEQLSGWDGDFEGLLLRQDLHKSRRFCLDGYYYRTFESYEPYAENGFFRNPANFTGAQLLDKEGAAGNIGYAMTKICLLNQNPYGFWETGPRSSWLYDDYGIGYGFYDTRFSTDFARSLLVGYKLFGDLSFLEGAVKYADFLIGYAEREGYTGGELKEGILVPDYWGREANKKTHVSLNHQLAETNFLIEAFNVTGEQKYIDCAQKLLAGIEETSDEWIMDDKNLKYALMYETSSNIMADYPYLTYNDLYETSLLLEGLGQQSGAVNALMESKKEWMDNNGVTGYKK